MQADERLYDAIVVGGGPAGLSAASWLARYRRTVLVLDEGEHRNRWTEEVHGYLGADPASPAELLEGARAALLRYPSAEVRPDRATSIRRVDERHFTVEGEGPAWTGRRLVLATGVVDEFPDVHGFFRHYGADVFHCPTCDGYEARGRNVLVFGWSENVAGFALELLEWAASVTVVTDGRPFEGDDAHREALSRHGIPLLEDEAIELVGSRGNLRSARMRRGGNIVCDLAFFTIGHRPAAELAEQLGCDLTSQGYVRVDLDGVTSVAGVYAAGDLTPGTQLVQVATAEGATAGISCALSLRGERGASDNGEPGPDVEQELER